MNFVNRSLGYFYFVFFFISGSLKALESQTLILAEKAEHILEVGSRHEVTLSDPFLASVTPHSAHQVKIQTHKKGQVTLTFEAPDQEPLQVSLEITSKNLQKKWKVIHDQLGDLPDLIIALNQDQIVLQGRLLTPSDVIRVQKTLNDHPNVLNLTEFDRSLWEKTVALFIQRRLEAPGIFVTLQGSRLLLEGQVTSTEDQQRLIRKAQALLPRNLMEAEVVNLIQVRPFMVHVDLTFMQISRSGGESEGFNILKTLFGDGSLSWQGSGGPQQSLVLNAQGRINQVIRKGWGEVLARPKITILSGKEGIFQDGGRRFVPSQDEGQPLEIDYGLLVKVTPDILANGDIQLKVAMEVSAPQGGRDSLDFSRFRTETEVFCSLGQTLILSGLASELENQFQEKTPLLGQIPLLRTFFSSRDDDKRLKDLLLLITPSIPQIEKDTQKGRQHFQTLRELIRQDP